MNLRVNLVENVSRWNRVAKQPEKKEGNASLTIMSFWCRASAATFGQAAHPGKESKPAEMHRHEIIGRDFMF